MAISYRLLRALLTRPTVRMGLRTSTLSNRNLGGAGSTVGISIEGHGRRVAGWLLLLLLLLMSVTVGGPGHSRAHVTRGLHNHWGLGLGRFLEKHVLARKALH